MVVLVYNLLIESLLSSSYFFLTQTTNQNIINTLNPSFLSSISFNNCKPLPNSPTFYRCLYCLTINTFLHPNAGIQSIIKQIKNHMKLKGINQALNQFIESFIKGSEKSFQISVLRLFVYS